MSGAQRQRRLRQRERDGLRVWHVELPDDAMTEALITEGFISEAAAQDHDSEAAAQDHDACCAALERVIRLWLAERAA